MERYPVASVLLFAALLFASCGTADADSKPKTKCGEIDGRIVCYPSESPEAKKIKGNLLTKLGGKKQKGNNCVIFAPGADLKNFCPTGVKNCKVDAKGEGVCCCR